MRDDGHAHPPALVCRRRRRKKSAQPTAAEPCEFHFLPAFLVARIIGALLSDADPRPGLRIARCSRLVASGVQSAVRARCAQLNMNLVGMDRQLRLICAFVNASPDLRAVHLDLGHQEVKWVVNWLAASGVPLSQATTFHIQVRPHATPVVEHHGNRTVLDVEIDSKVLSVGEVQEPLILTTFREAVQWTGAVEESVLSVLARCAQRITNLDLGGMGGFLGSVAALQSWASTLLVLSITISGEERRGEERPLDFATSDGCAFAPDAVSDVIPLLTSLRTLTLRETRASCRRPLFALRSQSVQFVDVRKCYKHFLLGPIECPQLRDLYCVDSIYGTGIRRIANGEVRRTEGARGSHPSEWRWDESRPITHVRASGHRWVSHIYGPMDDTDDVSLPAECVVHFGDAQW